MLCVCAVLFVIHVVLWNTSEHLYGWKKRETAAQIRNLSWFQYTWISFFFIRVLYLDSHCDKTEDTVVFMSKQ